MINNFMRFLLKFFIILFILFTTGTAYFLVWNKYHNIEIWSLKHVKSMITPVAISPIKPINNYKLVYVNGDVMTHDKLFDRAMNLNINAISMARRVFMYQWEETIPNKELKNEAPSYHYQKNWSEHLIDSANFHFQNSHENPIQKPLESTEIYAARVTLGDFILSKSLIRNIKKGSNLVLTDKNAKALEQQLGETWSIVNGGRMICTGDMAKPHVGDICIEVSAVLPENMSIIAQQMNSTLRPYRSPTGVQIAIIDSGKKNPDEMINATVSEYDWNSPLTPIKTFMRKTTGF